MRFFLLRDRICKNFERITPLKTIYTIGFSKKTAEEFFNLLEKNFVSVLVDIRLNNSSNLAVFSRFPDLPYFLRRMCNIGYIHDKKFAPSKKILQDFKQNKIDWSEYKTQFLILIESRNVEEHIKKFYTELDKICFLCSEQEAEHCHRRIVAERFEMTFRGAEIIHL